MVDLQANAKALIVSKTFWANVLMIASACAAYVAGQLSTGATIGAIAFGVVGIIIRNFTSSEITGFFK
jgi:hypothetical protein